MEGLAVINININGDSFSVEEKSLHDILLDLKFLQKWSAVEVNGEIIQRDELMQRMPQTGDKIEVITPVGGGA